MSRAFRFEIGVPIPMKSRKARPAGWPRMLAEAQIGASVFVEGLTPVKVASYFKHYGSGWYKSRSVENGVRVWKVSEPPKVTARVAAEGRALSKIDRAETEYAAQLTDRLDIGHQDVRNELIAIGALAEQCRNAGAAMEKCISDLEGCSKNPPPYPLVTVLAHTVTDWLDADAARLFMAHIQKELGDEA